MELFQKIFEEVRLLSAEEIGNAGAVESGEEILTSICQCRSCAEQERNESECIAVKVLKEKNQKTKLEYLNGKLYEIVARYVEVDGEPYVMEMVRQVEEELIIEKEEIDFAGNVKETFFDKLYIDALSGAYNRRYFEDCLRKRVIDAGVAMIDLDDFKISNDTYGHDLGDRLLHLVSYTIMGLIRKTDALIRYGGDEFLLIMPYTTKEHFQKKLEEIQYQIHMIQVPDSRGVFLSVSIGGVIAKKQTVEKAMFRADKVMYVAKKRKNSIVTEWNNGESFSDWEKRYEYNEKQKILIVDDSEMNRAILNEMLHEEFIILEAENGEECINLLRKYGKDISLVLLDIVMPVMDGFAVLEQMNRNKWIEDSPVIMISFYSSDPALDGAVNTHRVVSVEEDEGKPVYITKGDGNNTVDSYNVKAEDLIGKVVGSSMLLGKISRLVSNPIIFIPVILVPLAVILISNLVKTLHYSRKIMKEEEEKAVLEAVRQMRENQAAKEKDPE